MNTNDEAFDENGMLKDGKVARVRMTMRDSKSIKDGPSLNMHKPGYRYIADADQRIIHDARVEAAYEAADEADAEAYKNLRGWDGPASAPSASRCSDKRMP